MAMLLHKQAWTCLLIAILLCSCGYRWGQGEYSVVHHRTISVPYIEGDLDGEFTSALVHALSASGSFVYVPTGGDLLLRATIVNEREDDVSFRYDHTRKGRLRKSVIPDETRIIMSVDIVVLEAASGCEVVGPVRLAAEVEFDHDYYSSCGGVNVFSLGQLTDIDEARDAAHTPLYRRLSEKIVDYIINAW